MPKFDFAGYATKNDLLCSDGRTIRKGAFSGQDGEIVPLVWNHQHNEPDNVLGHAMLKNVDDGVRAYCLFNDTESGRNAKQLVEHGDIKSLSIYANQLKEQAGNVLHGAIREVSLVLAGANPGAYIDTIAVSHADGGLEEAIIYTGEEITMDQLETQEEEIKHADQSESKESPKTEEKKETPKEDKSDEETVQDVIDSMNEKQKNVLFALVGQALEENGGGGEQKKEEDMKHNVFESDTEQENNFLSHDDMQQIFRDAKRCGSLKEATEEYLNGATLAHSIDTTGMTTATGNQTYGVNDVDMLFPDYKSLNTPPEFISRNMDWVSKVIGGVHHTPFTRIKSMYANITEDEARAKGYIKGNQKKNEVFTTLKRTTDPQTIYKKQKLDRDDIIDITDFDVVAWIKSEMRVMLNEEIARAILIGDGRLSSSDDKIQEQHIRPIVTDVPLFNITYTVNNFSAKQFIDECVRARIQYKGSGNPTLFTTENLLTEMLLIEDGIGHKIYKSESELATALRVTSIVTVEPMEGYQVGGKDLLGVIVNLKDYNVGTDKGGEINLFDDFDIDYNQYAYLMETRMSGALVKPFSAITLVKGTTGSNTTTTSINANTTETGD